ncbi:hypothetical protein V8G54_034521, partial [Vigna mungo]
CVWIREVIRVLWQQQKHFWYQCLKKKKKKRGTEAHKRKGTGDEKGGYFFREAEKESILANQRNFSTKVSFHPILANLFELEDESVSCMKAHGNNMVACLVSIPFPRACLA